MVVYKYKTKKDKMPNYENSKIYKLVNNIDDKIYIGSTVARLSKRKGQHKEKSIKCPDRKVYKHINQVGWGNVDIVLIEKYPCKDKEELHARERYFIEELKAELNNNKPLQTIEEYREINKEKFKKYDKERYIGERKEYAKQKAKESYEKNKDKINERRREKINCECGGKYSISVKARHMKTKKHLKYIESQK
jgi:group I intron endonuclease